MNFCLALFLICKAWKSNCVLPLTMFPAALAGLLWEIFFGCFFWDPVFIFPAGSLQIEVTFLRYCHIIEPPIHFWPSEAHQEGGSRARGHHSPSCLKMAKKGTSCEMTPRSQQALELWLIPFSLLPSCSPLLTEHAQSQGCVLVGCGCVTGWDP